MEKRLRLFGLMLLVVAFAGAPTRAAPDIVRSAPTGSQSREIDYSHESWIGIAHLIARPDTASLLFRVDGTRDKDLPIGVQAELIRPLLGQYVREHDHPRRLFVVFRDTSDIFQRIQDTSIKSIGWDANAGRPREGTVSAFVVHQVNIYRLARELQDSFAAFGYALEAKSAEQIIVNRANPGRVGTVPVSGVIGFIAVKETPK